jgi:hypothetical protein
VTTDWQAVVSEWLVSAGCRYMMAWGRDCSSWDDSVDMASIQIYPSNGTAEIDEHFVFSTWHANDPLSEVFWFAKHCADHPALKLGRTVIIDITAQSRSSKLLDAYHDA